MPAILFHVSPSVNRDSIRRHGLDVSRMGAVSGIAGSPTPEAVATHLADDLWSAWWYATFRIHSRVDIWQVDVAGLRLQEINEGWLCHDVIDPERLVLVEEDLQAAEARRRLDMDKTRGSLTGDIGVVIKKRVVKKRGDKEA